MRSSSLTLTVLSGLLATGWAAPVLAQAAFRDGQDLPCNAFCREWLGPAYTGPAAEDDRVAAPAALPEPAAQTDDRSWEPRASSRKSTRRSPARERTWARAERRWDAVAAENAESRPLRVRPPMKAAAVPAKAPSRMLAAVPAAETKPAPEPALKNRVEVPAPAAGASDGAAGQPSARLDADGKMLTLSVNGTPSQEVRLTAAQADQLVQSIGAARAQMKTQPEQNWAFGQTVSTVYDPRWTTEAERRKGDTLLHIRDPRFGWLHYTVPRMTAQQLGNLLQKQATRPLAAARRAEAAP